MSDGPQREMTLREWVESLPECHLARKQYTQLIAQLQELAKEKRTADAQALDQSWRDNPDTSGGFTPEHEVERLKNGGW